MSKDVEYHSGDNEMDNGNYATIQSARPIVERLLRSRYRPIDGIPFGHKGWVEMARSSPTRENIERWRRYTVECMKLAEGLGLVSDVAVTVDDDSIGNPEVSCIIDFFDKLAGRADSLALTPPWLKVA